MVRRLFKIQNSDKINQLIKKYNIPREYLSVNRKSITRGVFIGLFWGFIPMPMQMLAVILTTPFIKFNVPVAISMVWLSNPITMPLMYYMEYKTGLIILGKNGIEDIELTLDWFSQHWGDILVPLYIGTIPYSTIVAFFIAMFINWLWIQSVKRAKCKRVKRL